MTKLYRVVAYVLDLNHNATTKEDVIDQIENSKYPEFIDVQEVRETDIGPWDDDHVLNQGPNMAQYDSYFAELDATGEKDPWFKQEHQRVRSIMMREIQKNIKLEQENIDLKNKIKGLEKVQDFIDTVKSLSK